MISMEWVYIVAILSILIVATVLILFLPKNLKKLKLILSRKKIEFGLNTNPAEQERLTEREERLFTEFSRNQLEREKQSGSKNTSSSGAIESGVNISDTLGINSEVDVSGDTKANIRRSTLYGSKIKTRSVSDEKERQESGDSDK